MKIEESKRLVMLMGFMMSFSGSLLSMEQGKQASEITYRPSLAYDSQFFVESNLEFTLLHELSHAVIELNNIPVLGGNERAADQIAIMLMIMAGQGFDEVLFDKMLSISGEWMIEWREEINRHPLAFWDVHPLAIQRFYDVTCLVYGAAPDKLEQIRRETWLPIERAWECDKEYTKNRRALLWLAENYSRVSFNEHWQLFQKEAPPTDQTMVSVEFIPPTNRLYESTYQWLKQSERLQYLMRRTNEILKLPVPITIYFETQCTGPDAWWNPNINGIVICYALLEEFKQNANKLKPLVERLAVESELAFLFLFPEKYSGLLAHEKEAMRKKLMIFMDRFLNEE